MANSIWGTPNGLSVNGATVTFPLGTQLTESALGTLAMVSSAATNQLQIPNGSNAEYAVLRWASNFADVGVVTNGGTSRFIRVLSPAGSGTILASGGADRWQVDSSGNLVTLTDNTPDIGASAATRPRNVIVGTRVTAPAYTVGSTAGANFGPAAAVSITVINGIVTAAS